MTDEEWDVIFNKLSLDISDRRGLKWEWNAIDPDVILEIKDAWRDIVEGRL
jgi:hypothetical protein